MSAEFGPSGGTGIATGGAIAVGGGIEGGMGAGVGSFGSGGPEVGLIGAQSFSPSIAEIGAPTLSQGFDTAGGRHIASENPFSGTEPLLISPSLPNISMDTKIIGTPTEFLGPDYTTLWSMPAPLTGSEIAPSFSHPSFDSSAPQAESTQSSFVESSTDALFSDVDSFLKSSSQTSGETDMFADIQSFLQKEASVTPQGVPEVEEQPHQDILSNSEKEALRRLTTRIESIIPATPASPEQETIDSIDAFLRSTSRGAETAKEISEPDNVTEVEAVSVPKNELTTNPFRYLKEYTVTPSDPGGRVARLDGIFVTIAKNNSEKKTAMAPSTSDIGETAQPTSTPLSSNVNEINAVIPTEQTGLVEDNSDLSFEPSTETVIHTSNDVIVADAAEASLAEDEKIQPSEAHATTQEMIDRRPAEEAEIAFSETEVTVRLEEPQLDLVATEIQADAKVKARIGSIVKELIDEEFDDDTEQILRRIANTVSLPQPAVQEATEVTEQKVPSPTVDTGTLPESLTKEKAYQKIGAASVSLKTAEPVLDQQIQAELKAVTEVVVTTEVKNSTNEQQITTKASIAVEADTLVKAGIVEDIDEDDPERTLPMQNKTAIIDEKITERRVGEIGAAYDEARDIVVETAEKNPLVDEDSLIVPGALAAKILAEKSIENDPEFKSTIAGENADKTLVHTINEIADIDVEVGELGGSNAKNTLKTPVYNHPAVTVDFEPTAATEEQVNEVFDPSVKKKGEIFNSHSHIAQNVQLTRS